jgi:YfiH family protein
VSGAPFLRAPGIGVAHGFFTRAGGVSSGGYASLNGSLSGGDERACVVENRGRVAAALGLDSGRLMGVSQVHGTAVVRVVAPWAVGAGAVADGMVTSELGLGLVVITADCAPVLLADAQGGVVGAAHAGWRGAVGGVLEATVAAMRAIGAGRIVAGVGPCIGQASYQVGEEVRAAVVAVEAEDGRFFAGDGVGHFRFDLGGYCVARLERVGVMARALEVDTCAEEARFFSHRRRTLAGGGTIGHQMSAIRC